MSPSLILPFIAVYFLTGFAHRFDIWYRNHYDELPWYSRSFGISQLHRLVGLRVGPLPAIDDWFIYQYVEPAVCLLLGWTGALLGYLAQLPTFTLGLWLVLAACALFAKNQILYYRERDLFLNMNDARIVSMNLVTSARGEANKQRDGWSAPPLPRASIRTATGGPTCSTRRRHARRISTCKRFSRRTCGRSRRRAPRRHSNDHSNANLYSPLAQAGVRLAGRRVRGCCGRVHHPDGHSRGAVRPGRVPRRARPAGDRRSAARPCRLPESGHGRHHPIIGDTRPAADRTGDRAHHAARKRRAAAGRRRPPLSAPRATALADAPGGDSSDARQGNNPDMFAGNATAIPGQRPGPALYAVTAQTSTSTVRVTNAVQTGTGLVLTMNYDAKDGRKIDISAPGDKDAFYIVSGGKRYPLIAAAGIAIGSTSQAVPVGGSLIFTLTFPPLDDSLLPFDLIEAEHTAAASASYWDITGIQPKAR